MVSCQWKLNQGAALRLYNAKIGFTLLVMKHCAVIGLFDEPCIIHFTVKHPCLILIQEEVEYLIS